MIVSDKLPVYILDSFVLLAYFSGEKGTEKVEEILIDASREACNVAMSLINIGEVLYLTERE